MTGSRSLPEGLLLSLGKTTAPRTLLIRHADRHHIPEGDTGSSTRLTDLGEQRSRDLGRALGCPPAWALASPLYRCMRTAELVGTTAEPSTLLGHPGPFVVDSAVGGEVFGRNTTEDVVRGQLVGNTWGCMRTLDDGAGLLHRGLLDALAAHGGTGIAVSHDAIVMPYIGWATGHSFEDEWLGPLDGIVITPGGVVWRGRRYEVPS